MLILAPLLLFRDLHLRTLEAAIGLKALHDTHVSPISLVAPLEKVKVVNMKADSY